MTLIFFTPVRAARMHQKYFRVAPARPYIRIPALLTDRRPDFRSANDVPLPPAFPTLRLTKLSKKAALVGRSAFVRHADRAISFDQNSRAVCAESAASSPTNPETDTPSSLTDFFSGNSPVNNSVVTLTRPLR
jgi:hypothetical protein